MGFADLTEEEEKFFETKGREGLGNEQVDTAQDNAAVSAQAEPEIEPEPAPEQREPGGGIDATDDGETAADSSAGDVEESDDRRESESTGKKRDFEKAFSVAESKRLELKRQLKEQAEQTAALKSQLDQLVSQVKTPQATEAPVPDKDEDPMGYYAHQLQNVQQTVTKQQEYLQQQAQEYQRSQQMNQFLDGYKRQAQEFQQTQADFADAYRYLEQSRIDEYTAAGYTPAEASRLLQEDEIALAVRAQQDGVNPAERLYLMAKSRGYAPNTVPAKMDSKLEKVEQGLKKGKSLSNAKSKSVTAKLDASMIDQMSEEEFDKYFSQMKQQAKNEKNYVNY